MSRKGHREIINFKSGSSAKGKVATQKVVIPYDQREKEYSINKHQLNEFYFK